jgi:hypothetical protein
MQLLKLAKIGSTLRNWTNMDKTGRNGIRVEIIELEDLELHLLTSMKQ